MKQGYKFLTYRCPRCGRDVPYNWAVLHVRSGCELPQTKKCKKEPREKATNDDPS